MIGSIAPAIDRRTGKRAVRGSVGKPWDDVRSTAKAVTFSNEPERVLWSKLIVAARHAP